MNQRVTCVIALLIALYVAGGYLIVFQISREAIRSEMHEAIERNDAEEKAVEFSFSKSYWEIILIDDEEFMLDGKMYDIVSYKETEDSVIVSAICDSKENKLLALFSQLQPNSDSAGSLPEGLIHFLDSLMIIEEDPGSNAYFITDQTIGSSIIFPASSSYHLLIYSPPDFMKG